MFKYSIGGVCVYLQLLCLCTTLTLLRQHFLNLHGQASPYVALWSWREINYTLYTHTLRTQCFLKRYRENTTTIRSWQKIRGKHTRRSSHLLPWSITHRRIVICTNFCTHTQVWNNPDHVEHTHRRHHFITHPVWGSDWPRAPILPPCSALRRTHSPPPLFP